MAKEIRSDHPSGWWPVFRNKMHAFLLPYAWKTHRGSSDLPERGGYAELYMGAIQEPRQHLEILQHYSVWQQLHSKEKEGKKL